jgi:outer membrane autotransporter protein
MTFTPHLSLAWRHAWGDLSTSPSLSFAEMTAQGFSVSGVSLAEDTGLIDLGFDLAINPQATLGLACLGQFSDGADTNALRATLAWAF